MSNFECTTCSLAAPDEAMMKHLASARHKTVRDARSKEELACEECGNSNIHQLQIVRFGGDDMVLLCQGCYAKLYKGIEKPMTAYSLANGAILRFWGRYKKVRDCRCDKCHSDSSLNAGPNGSVLCNKCLKGNANAGQYVSESTGKFLFALLNIKDPSGAKNKGKGAKKTVTRRKGRFGGKRGARSGSKPKSSDRPETRSKTSERPDTKSKASTKPDAKSKSAAKPDSKSKSAAKPDSKSKASAKPDSKSKASAKPDPKSRPDSKSKSKSSPKTNTKTKISAKSDSKSKSKGKPDTKPKTKPDTKSKSKSKSKGKGSGPNDNKPTGVLKKIDAESFQNRKDNTKIESGSRLNLKSFTGFKAVTSDSNLAATIMENVDKNIARTQSGTDMFGRHRDSGLNISALNKPSMVTQNMSEVGMGSCREISPGTLTMNTPRRNERGKKEKNGEDKLSTKDKKTKKGKKESQPPLYGANTAQASDDDFTPEFTPKKSSNDDDWGASWTDQLTTPSPNTTAKKSKTKKRAQDVTEEGVQNSKFTRFSPKLTFPDLTTYLDTFSQALYLEQKLENDFIEDFQISWPANPRESVFIVDFQSRNNSELKKLIMPHMANKTNNPFNERQPLMLTTADESIVWYTFIKELREERSRVKLLLELFPWNKLPLPTRLGSEHLKLLPVSAQANRIMFAMTRIKNKKFIELLLGNKKIKPIHFNNRLKFSRESLNASQRCAIEYVLNNAVTVIQGPPGTGKTSTIEELIHQIIKNFHSFPILCVAASNIAIDNIAERFMDNKVGIKVLRILSDRKESEYNMSHPLGKICLHNIVHNMLPGDLREADRLMRTRGKSAISVSTERKLFQIKAKLVNTVIAQAQIICTTNITAGGRQLKSIKEVPTVIMDESTQSSEATTLVPLSLPGIKTFLFVGDEKQLSSFSNIPQLEMSLFERILLNNTCGEPQMLDTQYRMHPDISEFPIRKVYNSRLLNGVTAADKEWPGIAHPLFFYQCDQGYEERAYGGGGAKSGLPGIPIPATGGGGGGGFSYQNRYECQAILEIVYKLHTEKQVPLDSIGIITAYSAQRDLLSDVLLSDPIINPRREALVRETDEDEFLNPGAYPGHDAQSHVVNVVNKLQIATVDSFQGHEKPFIIFSCVRNNADNKIGFLADKRRLNVALTRAKNGLVIVGNATVLRSGNTIWTDFVRFLEARNAVHETLEGY